MKALEEELLVDELDDDAIGSWASSVGDDVVVFPESPLAATEDRALDPNATPGSPVTPAAPDNAADPFATPPWTPVTPVDDGPPHSPAADAPQGFPVQASLPGSPIAAVSEGDVIGDVAAIVPAPPAPPRPKPAAPRSVGGRKTFHPDTIPDWGGHFYLTYSESATCPMGRWQALCPYHKLNDRTACTRSMSLRVPEDKDRLRVVIKKLVPWCLCVHTQAGPQDYTI